jgi:uncharacterized 2Fe-2S/4Fe-4S cluster protein (DUF4445 family)
MPRITFKPMNKSIDVLPGTELLEAARQAKIEFESPCGGKGTCGKCLVRVVEGHVESDSLGLLIEAAISQGYVLACKSQLLDDPITIEIPEQIGIDEGKYLVNEYDIFLIDKDRLPQKSQLNPLATKQFLTIPVAQLEDGLSDMDRLTREIRKVSDKKNVVYPLPVLQLLADALRSKNGNVTVTFIMNSEQCHVIDIEPGDVTANHYGIAVDVGTTTIAVQLVSLPEGKVIATQTAYNDQLVCGLDVISRINYAQKPNHLEELRTRVLRSINQLIQQVSESHDIKQQTICNGVIAGNTTMIHLLLGLKPEYIRMEPYTPTVRETPYLTAEKVRIKINPASWIYFSPHVGSYVGGDITSGILCTDLASDTEEMCLFIDIGTNGELVLGNRDFLMTCACSAGPAFEGGGIEHGMRASTGAIDNISIDDETGASVYTTIGNTPPKGICGTGMISLLAELFLKGWIDAAGKLNRDKKSPAIKLKGRRAEYIIVPEKESGTEKPIAISEIDIENMIRAKAAIYSACSLMLKQVGSDFKNIKKIYIAGGFGRYLNIENAITIGLVPDLPREVFQYVGNASLMGAYMVLVSQEYRKRQIELARKMTYIELNTDSHYMDQYMGAMFLPHTNEKLFPSVIKKTVNSQTNSDR